MKNTTEAISREQAERMCERLNQLTCLGLRLEQRGNGVLLHNGKGPAGYWMTWSAAYKSIFSSAKIVELAYLNNVLLCDNIFIAHAEARQKLAETVDKLETTLKAINMALDSCGLSKNRRSFLYPRRLKINPPT